MSKKNWTRVPSGLLKAALISSVGLGALCAAGLAQAADTTGGKEVSEVVVTGIRASLQKSVDTKRKADAVVDSITAEDVGKFPDKNVAESLQRVTGIAVQRDFGEGERLSIRGTAPNLNKTLLNGHSVATADWFIIDQQNATRSFNYTMLPSEVVGRVDVYKSAQADVEEGGIGGVVNVQTRNPLDMPALKLNATIGGNYNDLSAKSNWNGSGMASWHNADKTIGLMLGLTYEKRDIRRDGIEVLGELTKTLGGKTVTTPDLLGSTLFRQDRERTGANFGAQFRPTDKLDVNFTALYSKMEANNFNHNYMAWVSQMWGANTSTLNPISVDSDGYVVRGSFVKDTPTVDGKGNPVAAKNGAVYDAILRKADTDTKSADLDLKYKLNEQWNLHAKFGTTEAEGRTSDEMFYESNAPTGFTFDMSGNAPKFSFADLNPKDPSTLNILGWAKRNRVSTKDREDYFYGDAERFLDSGLFKSVKFGFKYTDHNRETTTTYGQRRSALLGDTGPFTYCTSTGTVSVNTKGAPAGAHPCGLADVSVGTTPSDYNSGLGGGALGGYALVDAGKLAAFYNSLPMGTDFPNFDHFGPQESFKIQEKTTAAYVMGKFAGEGFRGNLGIRYVRTEGTSKGWAIGVPATTPGSVDNPFGRIAQISTTKTSDDFLPSANVVFDLKKDLLFRIAAARVIARPDYNQLSNGYSLTPKTLTGTGGNAKLDGYSASQYDASLEWYFAPQSLLSVGLFYKDISNYIVNSSSLEILPTQIADVDVTRQSLCTATSSVGVSNCPFQMSRPVNGGGGTNKGLEFTWQQSLWNGFGVQTNYTYSEAESQSGAPIPSNSRHSANLTGYYEAHGLSARLSYSYRSKFFINIDRGRELWSDEIQSLDASINYAITKNITAYVDAVNLTGETLYQYYDGKKSHAARVYDNGRQYFFGLRLSY